MSIIKKRFSAWLIFAEILLCAFAAHSQDIEAKITISEGATVGIEGKLLNENSNTPIKNWSFTNSIAGIENPGTRISDFKLTDSRGSDITVKKLIDGEYFAEQNADAFRYRINLNALQNIRATAHVSWIAGEQGVLMLDDLLPQGDGNQPVSAKIKFELPPDWKIISSENNSGDNIFSVKNARKAIFIVGKNWREVKNRNLNLAISGEWQFSDEEAARMANEIFETYRKLFGEATVEKAQISIVHFPAETKFGRWEAETRGTTLTVASSDMPFKTTSLQRLHEQLRHELFHLWIPNKLALTGNYDWFYEGFTVYQALRTGIATNQIRFEDFLSTLAEAYNLDSLQPHKVSLIEASKNRLSGANSQIYARGMLIAFLCDLAILKQSKEERSIDNIFREIYQKHRVPNEPVDGNTAILNILKSYSETKSVVENYIEGTAKIDWEADLESVGIEAKEENSFIKLAVKTKLNGGQKRILDKLGYNNWRKISENLK